MNIHSVNCLALVTSKTRRFFGARVISKSYLAGFVRTTDEGMSNCVDRKRDPVLDPYLAHELSYVSLHGALLDLKGLADLAIGGSSHKKLKHFFFAIGERHAACGKDFSGR